MGIAVPLFNLSTNCVFGIKHTCETAILSVWLDCTHGSTQKCDNQTFDYWSKVEYLTYLKKAHLYNSDTADPRVVVTFKSNDGLKSHCHL